MLDTQVGADLKYPMRLYAQVAFIDGAQFERQQIMEFIERLKKVEKESLPSKAGATEIAMSSYVIGELDGILHVLEQRNAT